MKHLCGDKNCYYYIWNCVKANKAGEEMSNRNCLIHFSASPTHCPMQKRNETTTVYR